MSYESQIEIFEETVSSQYDKTLEEAVMQEVTRIGVYVDKHELIRALQYDRDQYNRGYHDGINAKKWISTKDRLPELYKEVLVTRETGGVSISYLSVNRIGDYYWIGLVGNTFPLSYVSAWQPLPVPYEEDE